MSINFSWFSQAGSTVQHSPSIRHTEFKQYPYGKTFDSGLKQEETSLLMFSTLFQNMLLDSEVEYDTSTSGYADVTLLVKIL
jgi:hypothetical protein